MNRRAGISRLPVSNERENDDAHHRNNRTSARDGRADPGRSGARARYRRDRTRRGAGAGQRAGPTSRGPGRWWTGSGPSGCGRMSRPAPPPSRARMRASRQPPAPPWNMPPIWIIASCFDEARTPRDVWAKAAHLLMGWAQGKPVDRMAALSMCEAADENAFDPELGGYHPELGGYSPDVLQHKNSLTLIVWQLHYGGNGERS